MEPVERLEPLERYEQLIVEPFERLYSVNVLNEAKRLNNWKLLNGSIFKCKLNF